MKKLIMGSIMVMLFCFVRAQHIPELGAEVWIEPGDTPEQIEGWFKTMSDHNMKVARMFIMWNFVEPTPGAWDFSLYDQAFDAAEKYGIHVVATLTTNRRAAHRGDYYQLHGHAFEDSWERLQESEVYIEKVVNHWKDHPSLDSWMLTNEASQSPGFNPLAVDRYRSWLEEKYGTIAALNVQWSTYFASFDEIMPHDSWIKRGYWYWQPVFVDFTTFWREHVSWWLNWISVEVRKYDQLTPMHAHSGGITGNLARRSYDLPSWKKFSNSMGTTIHPSWNFDLFGRDQFPMAISFCAELMRGASDPHPFWVTELQGGQNIFSGRPYPLTPTENDIAQWTWISVMEGAEKTLYWMLNTRSKGFEVNEWSMLDFHGRPTERIETAGAIAGIIEDNPDLFAQTKMPEIPVTILMSLETMTNELYVPDNQRMARSMDAHTVSVYSYYETFLEMGIPVQIKQMHDFDWTGEGTKGHLVVMPHVLAITAEQAENMALFVENGGNLLITGLSGMYDETSKSWLEHDYPLVELLGANFKDCRLIGEEFTIQMIEPDMKLPATYWEGEIENLHAEIIGKDNERIVGVKNSYGSGQVVFIPSTLGLGAWQFGNTPLSEFLDQTYPKIIEKAPVRFQKEQNKVILLSLQSGDSLIVMITNGKTVPVEADLIVPRKMKHKILWGTDHQYVDGKISLGGRETVVIQFGSN